MQATSWKMLSLGITFGSVILFASPLIAQRRGGEGGGHGGEGVGVRAPGGLGVDVHAGGGLGVGVGVNRDTGRGGAWDGTRVRVNVPGGRGWDGDGYRNHWDRGYNSYYGRGWDYRPNFGWGINVGPVGVGFGDYGYPRGAGWGPYGWGGWGSDDRYGYWGPQYDNYTYDADDPSAASGEESEAYAQDGQQDSQDEQSQNRLPPIPTSQELAGMTEQQLQSFIAWIARGFTRELGQFGTGETWVKYFRLNDLRALAPRPPRGDETSQTSARTTVADRDIMEEVMTRVDSASKNSEYQAVTSLWGFKALSAALHEASRSPEQRVAGVLKAQTEMFSKSLARLSTGDGWRKHLEIDSLQKAAENPSLKSSEDIERLATRFDRVAQNPEHQPIAQLPGFQGIRSALHEVIDGGQPRATAKREQSGQEKRRE